ncbi:MAG: SGNH/GDSL hydrolase family protein [Alloprevotella sp.]|nr:SGNH/GDSL hydrolase family protein [Alloprevotella sp.]
MLAAACLLAYALSPGTIGLGGVTLKKLSLPIAADTTASETEGAAADTIAALDEAPQRILFVGDSMLEGLSRRFGDYAAANGHKLDVVLWYSSTTERWATSDTLTYFLRRYDPTFVVVCLGSNELFVRDLPDRDRHIATLLQRIGSLPYVWISPPNWKEDTGINDLILRHVGERRYFDSRHLTLQRGRDRAHPTFAAAAQWMDSVATWMAGNTTAHPIRMERPDTTAKPNSLTLLSPE